MTKPKLKLTVPAKKSDENNLPFTIESGIACPPKRKPNPYLEVFSKMNVDDSFLIGEDKKLADKVKNAAAKYGKENNMTFAFRNMDNGARCWRVK